MNWKSDLREQIERGLTEIARKNGIKKIHFIRDKNHDLVERNGLDTYINKSYIAGSDEIFIGIYSDYDLMIISFFYLLGCIIPELHENMYNSPFVSWLNGFKIAKEYGYNYYDNQKVLDWCEEQFKIKSKEY